MKKQRGLSIIEIILFIMILGLSIPPLLIVASNTYNQSINMEMTHVALNLAQQKMEEVISKEFGSVVNEPLANFVGQFNAYEYEVIVHYVTPPDLETSVDPTATKYKRIEVRVVQPNIAGTTITFLMVIADD